MDNEEVSSAAASGPPQNIIDLEYIEMGLSTEKFLSKKKFILGDLVTI